MTTLTMSELNALGFDVEKSVEDNGNITQTRKKGVITIQTTWSNNTFKTLKQVVKIECDSEAKNVSKNQLIFLDQIFNN